jgi:hypothetical protein
MPYLDAALAFAMTMLAVATLVTQIVRLGYAISNFRFDQLKAMLADYFTSELMPVIERELLRLNKKLTTAAIADVKKFAGKLETDLPFTDAELKELAEVSKEELVEQLKRSDFGKKLIDELKDEADTVFAELEKRYEAIEKKFTLSFRQNARVWATVIALILAFALNIDSIFIANTYISNEGMRQAVIAQKDSLEEGYTTLAEKLETEQEKTEITREEFEQAFADTQEQLDIFTSAGFPIGWSYYPHSGLNAEPSNDYDARANPLGFITWFAGCILTGLLAGLGGPFWYDVVAGISKAAKTARGQKA